MMMKLIEKRLWSFFIMILVVSMTMAPMVFMTNVTSASPDTHFFVDPPEAIDVDPLKVNVNITEAPPTYAWEFYLRWDSSLLELALVKKGTFLEAAGSTDFAYTPLDEANLKGEILIHCSLIGNVTWPSGDGLLCTLGFLVLGSGSTLLDLLDTRLWDHLDEGYPAPTYYRNEDCFFRNVTPPIHDLRISDVTVLTPEVTVGGVANVTVTVLNEGTETETFNLTVYADGTQIDTTTVNNLLGTGNSENRSFTYEVAWDTTGVPLGTYTISAYADPHVNETDTADNTLIDGKVKIAIHDLAVTSVKVLTPEVLLGEIANITVTVLNNGTEAENFNVTVKANETIIETFLGVGMPGSNVTYEVSWNTTGVPVGMYTISAYLPPVRGEVDTADNTFIDGTVTLLSPPVADFTYTSLVVNTPVNFTSTSYDPGGWITSWEWDLNGDGVSDAYTENATYTYTTEGDYTVTLNVTDNDGLTDTETKTLTVFPEVIHNVAVTNVTPSATEAVPGEEITITVVAKNKGSETETFNVTAYYDNTTIGMQNVPNLPSGSNTTLTFTWDTTDRAPGNYTISANATVVENETETEDNTFIDGTVTLLSPPVADFTENATTVLTGVEIHFDASGSEDPDGSIINYFWNFGDGTNATGVIVDHAYADDGTYTVTLTVTDDDGLTNSTSAVKTVLNRPPVALFTESAETVDTGVVIHFNASESYDPDGSILSYFWDFGDETNATGMTVTHEYVDDGVYTVTLTVTDDDEETDTATSTKTVLNRPPVAVFTESAETVDTGETITFNASDSYDPDGSIVSYFWDFGDETNATGVTVDHAYTDDGTYTVTLTVTDNDGASSPVSATKTVNAPEGWPLVVYAVIGLGIAALTLIALYALYRRRKE